MNKAIFRYIEHELYRYEVTKQAIEDMREDIIGEVPQQSGDVVSSFTISDTTQKRAIKLITNAALLRMTKTTAGIDRALDKLEDIHKQLFHLRYKERMKWQEVCEELPTSERTYFRVRRELVMMVALELGIISQIE